MFERELPHMVAIDTALTKNSHDRIVGALVAEHPADVREREAHLTFNQVLLAKEAQNVLRAPARQDVAEGLIGDDGALSNYAKHVVWRLRNDLLAQRDVRWELTELTRLWEVEREVELLRGVRAKSNRHTLLVVRRAEG